MFPLNANARIEALEGLLNFDLEKFWKRAQKMEDMSEGIVAFNYLNLL
jgi:hypothetical protein